MRTTLLLLLAGLLAAAGLSAQAPAGPSARQLSDAFSDQLGGGSGEPPLRGPRGGVLEQDGDSDGMEDLWEISHNLTVGLNDSALDPDNDTWTNLEEYLAGTDPRDPSAHPTDEDGSEEGGPDYLLPIAVLVLLGAIIVFLTVFLLVRNRETDDFSVEMD